MNSQMESRLSTPSYTCRRPALNMDESLSQISINENIMSNNQLDRIRQINKSFVEVFDNDLNIGYNHQAGRFFADFSFSNKPPPTRVFVPQFNKKCSDLQQAKCDELENQGVLVDPKKFDISVIHVSPSWIQQKGRAKHKNLQDCTLDELRFITAFNSLNDCIRPKPSSSCSANVIFLFLSRWKFHIFADLNNSYFQLPVKKSLWGYLGIMTPHKGIRVMTRTGQGLLGSDVELEQLLCRVLGDDISRGHCVAIRDDIVIGGNSIDDAISNYESVLSKLHQNNLKLSPNKVRIFPNDTEIYGYRVTQGCILPSAHTVTSLGKSRIEELKTNKQVNSWKGLYKTLIGHLPALSNLMTPFDSATAGKTSNEAFKWTPALTSAFNEAMNHLEKINKTYLPQPSEQLILLPDAMSTTPCVGWVLYVMRNNKPLPVSFCSAKLKDYMCKWYPCEKEAIGVVLSLDQCAHWIAESTKPTLIGPDSLAVVKAAELMKKGKHSSNPRLQSLLSSINRRNIQFFHNSAKAGKHIVPDCLSRLADKTCNSKDCAIERFLDDIPVRLEAMSATIDNQYLSLSALLITDPIPSPSIIAATSQDLADQLVNKSGSIPLGSHQTWIKIQKTDANCQAVFRLKSLGEAPRRKNTNPLINKIFKESEIHRGLLVVRSFDSKRLREVLKVVVPSTYLDSILTVLHIRLNHPKKSQLKLVFERYFFSPRSDTALSNLYASCHLCQGLKNYPKELESYDPKLFPDHPGHFMNVDILRRAGQMILVCVDLFSSYTTSCFAQSEKAEDLSSAIIQATTPIRQAKTITVRVDKAPGLVKLATTNPSSLTDLNITLIPGDDENKNANCSVDKAICELESELIKLSPAGGKINPSILAQATMLLNTKIRNRGYTAAELHFSRDSHDSSNLTLDDSQLSETQKQLRKQNHAYLSKSRAPKGQPQISPTVEQGDIVFLKSRGSKHLARDPHIVTDTHESGKVSLRKALHTSPNAYQLPNLSHKSKLVNPKFIYKPTSFHRSRFSTSPNCDQDQDSNSPLEIAKECLPWNPVSNESDETVVLISDKFDYNSGSSSSFSSESDDNESTINIVLNHEYDVPPEFSQNSPGYMMDVTPNPDDSDTIFLQSPSDSSDSSPPVRLFAEGESPSVPERLLQDRKPKVGDLISYFDSHSGSWLDAHIITDLNRRWKHYYNIMHANGHKDGLYLIPDTRWTFRTWRHDSSNDLETVRAEVDHFSDLDPTVAADAGLSLPGSSPQSPLADLDRSSDAHLTQDPLAIDFMDGSRTSSMEWDFCGTELGSVPFSAPESPSQVVLGRVSQLHSVLPIPLDLAPRDLDVPLNMVCNLDAVLPIASSPVHPRTRLSRPRQPLPREVTRSRSCTPSFFRRLFAFRKKE